MLAVIAKMKASEDPVCASETAKACSYFEAFNALTNYVYLACLAITYYILLFTRLGVVALSLLYQDMRVAQVGSKVGFLQDLVGSEGLY